MPDQPDQIDTVVAAILAAPKYRAIAPELVRAVAARELAAQRNPKAAIKAAKSKLHQVAAAYVEQRIDSRQWIDLLRTGTTSAARIDDALVQAARPRFAALGAPFIRASLELMARHSSTRERLPIMARFYHETLAELPPIQSALDIGCGLNPLALPWMPLTAGAVYYANDIDGALVDFIGQYLTLAGVSGNAEIRDQAHNPGGPRADLALILKVLPVLEQLERGAAARLLAAVDARFMLVTYPARSLGGRAKGMEANYERQFAALASGQDWSVHRFSFPGELAFLIRKGANP